MNVKLKNHKDLIAWQKSYELCLSIFKLCRYFPKDEQYIMISQIKRSALSVPSNIAEGYNRHSRAEYIRFLNIAYGSLAELETQLLISKELYYINQKDFEFIMEQYRESQRVLLFLIKSLK